MRTALVTGATGYVGGRLVTRLLEEGVAVRCLVRRPSKLPPDWRDSVTAIAGDVGDPEAVATAAEGCDVAYYLVHSLDREGYAEHDRLLATSFREGVERAGVGSIVYLGGLGDPTDTLSTHLASRQQVGEVLAAGAVPVTELRAAVIIGSGSASFEMLRALTEVLPVMVVPIWVHRTRCQPIAISDVLTALTAAGRVPAPEHHRVLELGGADVVTYRDLMDRYARVAGLRRRVVIAVPVLTPGLSSRWVSLVTPLPPALARELVSSLVNDVVVARRDAIEALGLPPPISVDEALRRAIAVVADLRIPTRWSGAEPAQLSAAPDPSDPDWAGGTLYEDIRVRSTTAPPDAVFATVAGIGGERGWYWGDRLWAVRGLVDKLIGGVGLRRGRRHPDDLHVGETLDFWRVDELDRPRLLRLRAEMRLPGHAWLEWRIAVDDTGATVVEQRARFVPRGVFGRLYWWSVVPFHHLLFPRLLRRVVAHAEAGGPPRLH